MFPLGMLMAFLAIRGWVDGVVMRLVEVLMIPSIYLLVALAAVLPPGLTSTERFLLIVLITPFVGWAGTGNSGTGAVD